jgi:S-adenosylmethionine uptake transporter
VVPQADEAALIAQAPPSAQARPARQNAAMSAAWLMVGSSLLFSLMGVCVKFASASYSTGEIVFYRGTIGALVMAVHTWHLGDTLKTRVPLMHLSRSVTGVTALCLWFYSIGQLPIATAVTLNYTSSLWMALFLIGGSLVIGSQRVPMRLIATVLIGFVGVALILRPTVEENQFWPALIGLLSGMLSATAYLQVSGLGRAGEPSHRVVFYFSTGSIVAGAISTFTLGWHPHTWRGIALLIAVGVLATTAQLLMTRAYTVGRPLVNASLQYLGIAFSYGWGVLLFDDRITWLAIGGMLLIVVAGLLATRMRSRPQAVADSTLPNPDSLSP